MVEKIMMSRAESTASPHGTRGLPRTGGLQPWGARAPRALRIAVDPACVAAFYVARHESGGTSRVIVFWLVSLVAFPYVRMAEYVGQRREAHWACIASGVVLVVLGAWRELGWLGGTSRSYALASEMIWLGVALAFAGAAHVGRAPPSAPAYATVGRLLSGLVSVASGAIWLWLQVG
jgi:hypothetical protein